MRRILLGLGVGALFLSCGHPTTYGQAIQQQKRSMLEGPDEDARRAPPSRQVDGESRPDCPTIAREGSRDYARCEDILKSEEQGIGGSGQPLAEPETDSRPEASPDVRYFRDSNDR